MFAPQDWWVATGDLFKRDADGELLARRRVRDVIRTWQGPLFTTPIRDALGDLPEVDLAVAYGVFPRGDEHQIAVAAMTLRGERELTARELFEHWRGFRPTNGRWSSASSTSSRSTTWYRPLTGPLRDEGIPKPGAGVRAWYRDASGDRYRPLTETARRRLVGAAA